MSSFIISANRVSVKWGRWVFFVKNREKIKKSKIFRNPLTNLEGCATIVNCTKIACSMATCCESDEECTSVSAFIVQIDGCWTDVSKCDPAAFEVSFGCTFRPMRVDCVEIQPPIAQKTGSSPRHVLPEKDGVPTIDFLE